MIQCPKCKELHEPGVRFCPNDGTPLTETAVVETPHTPSGQQPKSVELELPLVVGQRYRLEEVRGGGGMAKVYRAVDLTLERDVAVKLINPELRNDPEFDARFQREARIVSKLADPHIVVVHDFGLDPELGPYLVMEYLQGQSLRERIRSQGPLPFKAALQLSAQILLALMHAHDQSVIHRDIKPDNIFLLNQSGIKLHVRVLDFGIARIMQADEGPAGAMLTSPGAVLGTPRYMSPEQLAGLPVDERTDLYSAALVLHESLTGDLPYPGGARLCEQCPEATESLQSLIDDCLVPRPEQRPPNALEVYLRLQELGRASGVLLLPPDAIDKLLRARKKSEEPATEIYPGGMSPSGGSLTRRLVLGGIVLAALGGGAYFAKDYLFPPDPAHRGGPESLMGVQVGDGQQETVNLLNLNRVRIVDPWSLEERPDWLARTLSAKDLGLDQEALERLQVQWPSDESCTAMFHKNKLVALVLRDLADGQTGRGLQVGAGVGEVYRLYGNEHPSDVWTVALDPDEPESPKVEIRRYDSLGIAFEITNARISAISLYPPTSTGKKS